MNPIEDSNLARVAAHYTIALNEYQVLDNQHLKIVEEMERTPNAIHAHAVIGEDK